MKIDEFFQSQSLKHLTQRQKSSLYADFLQKRERRTQSSRWSLVSKRFFSYSVISIVALGSFFSSDWISGLFSNIDRPSVLQVAAQNIGTIVESEGTISITNNGRSLQSNTIQLNDQIVVADKSSIKILINESFQADIIGPATFEIVPSSKINDRIIYNLKFSNGGDYIAINTPKEAMNNEIAVQTINGVVIRNSAESKKSSFTIVNSSSEKNTTILNKSDNSLQVTKINSEDKKDNPDSIIINPIQIVEISTSETPSDTRLSLQILTTENLTKEKENNITIAHGGIAPSVIAQDVYNQSKKSTIANDVTLLSLSDEKETQEIIDKQITLIDQNLYSSFLRNDIKDIVTYHLLGNDNAAKIAYNNLNLRMQRILKIAGNTTQRKAQTVQDLIDTVEFVQSTLDNTYDSNLSKINYNLNTLLSRLELIKEYKFGVYKNISILSGTTEVLSFDNLVSMVGISPGARKYKFR